MFKMPAITFYRMDDDPFTERQTYWYGHITEDFLTSNNIKEWIAENFQGEVDLDLRFNNGSPKYFYRIYDPRDAMLFKLSFIGVEDE